MFTKEDVQSRKEFQIRTERVNDYCLTHWSDVAYGVAPGAGRPHASSLETAGVKLGLKRHYLCPLHQTVKTREAMEEWARDRTLSYFNTP